MSPSPIAATATALHAAHPALLSPAQPACTAEQQQAAARVDAARERLQGGREPATQMRLDVGYTAARVSP